MTVPIDDDVAEKFARTAGYINKVVSYVSDILRKSKKKLSGCLDQLYGGTKPSITIRIHVSRVPYLSEDFLAGMPETIQINYQLRNGESLADTDVGSSTITLYIDTRYNVDDVLDILENRLPHELRHLVDAHDSEMLETMIRTLDANTSGDKAAYASDRGEYNARLSAVLSVALKRLADPRIRSKIHSADDLVENIRWTSQYEDLMQDFDDKQYMAVRQNLVKILQNVMSKMN
jgi:hypothetical protein